MLIIKDYKKGHFDGSVYIPDTTVYVWHLGGPMPNLSGRVIEFQADGHELQPFLEALEKYSAKEKKPVETQPAQAAQAAADSAEMADEQTRKAKALVEVLGTIPICTGCGAWGDAFSLRSCVLPAQGKLSEIYPNGKSGYYCQDCVNKYKARKTENGAVL